MKASKIAGLKVHMLGKVSDSCEFYLVGSIPNRHLWAYQHLVAQDEISLSCGRTIYELIQDERLPSVRH